MPAVDIFSHLGETVVTSGPNSVTTPPAGTLETWNVADSTPFPSPQLNASQFQVVDVAAPSEIVDVLAVNGSAWTVKRGAGNTQPVTHQAGCTVRNTIVHAALMRMLSAVGGGGDIVVNLGDISGHVDADVSQGNYFKCRLVGNVDISFINVLNDGKNREWQLETQQDASGNHTLHINGVTMYDQKAPFAATTTANARDKFAFGTDSFPAKLWAAQTYKDAGNLDFDTILLQKNPTYFLKGEATTPSELDATANAHNGTWNGTPTYQQPVTIPSMPGAHGVAVSGDDYLVVDSPIGSLFGKFSVVFILSAPTPAANAGLVVYSEGSTTTTTPTLFISSGTSTPSRLRTFFRSDQNHVYADQQTSDPVFDGTTKLVVVTYDGTGAGQGPPVVNPTVKMYVNNATPSGIGIQNALLPTVGDTLTETESTWAAQRRITVASQLVGTIARMAVFSGVVLSAADVQDLLNAYNGS